MAEFFGDHAWMPLPDGRNMLVLFDCGFVDSAGLVWPSFRGDVIDGASIPRFSWSLFGGPYAGRYRKPAALHDTAYMYQLRGQRAADRMLCEAAAVAGCRARTCWILGRAVRNFGGSAWRDMDQGDRRVDLVPYHIAKMPANLLVPDRYVEAMRVLRETCDDAWAQFLAHGAVDRVLPPS